MIEARYTDGNKQSIQDEISLCKKQKIDTLHITSWDQDHCVPSQLKEIIHKYDPSKIECPGYEPHTDSGKEALTIIKRFKSRFKASKEVVQITPEYIKNLKIAKEFGYIDIFYHPKYIDPESSNNNSTIKQFRSGSFNVLSLGDVESTQISADLRNYRSIYEEVDIMILAHHGADNGFTTSSFLKKVKPKVAIASADYGNQFMHPKREIRDLLNKHEIKLFTTKTGDVVFYSTGENDGNYRVVNLKSGSAEVSSQYDFIAKKTNYLSKNADTIRALISRKNRGPR